MLLPGGNSIYQIIGAAEAPRGPQRQSTVKRINIVYPSIKYLVIEYVYSNRELVLTMDDLERGYTHTHTPYLW